MTSTPPPLSPPLQAAKAAQPAAQPATQPAQPAQPEAPLPPLKTSDKPAYHHGDLRAALLDAAAEEIAQTGLEAFSLRKVARRAGVSHAAPAHHFKDAAGLLTALAARGFEGFVAAQERREAQTDGSTAARLTAQALGIVDFAMAQTSTFRLMFSSDRPDQADVALADAAQAAFNKLLGTVAEASGRHPYQDADAMQEACALWAVAHGLADLVSSGKMRVVSRLPQAERDAALRAILEKAAPAFNRAPPPA